MGTKLRKEGMNSKGGRAARRGSSVSKQGHEGEENPSVNLPLFTIPGSHREWDGLRELEKGGETVTRGPNKRQDGTNPGSLVGLGLAESR